jgi:hypothetical protein
VIGHGASWLERDGLVVHFWEVFPEVPIVALLRSNDDPFADADFNCRADNPPLWERTVAQASEEESPPTHKHLPVSKCVCLGGRRSGLKFGGRKAVMVRLHSRARFSPILILRSSISSL